MVVLKYLTKHTLRDSYIVATIVEFRRNQNPQLHIKWLRKRAQKAEHTILFY